MVRLMGVVYHGRLKIRVDHRPLDLVLSEKELALVPGAVQDAEQFLASKSASIKRFSRVATLVEGFESPFGLELLATVHWIAVHESIREVEQNIAKVHAWNEHKAQFSDRQIRLALDVLQSQSWLAPITA